ncbi:uncharacterized protein HMPREF1541_10910 [Cyphellophora europaea CBS 101466]|uniref:Uncharacterized protein n=1 Tax=Cyphellophora europaea (strain CBS 101466) TaxID=1220924 RepID=W2S604_CYPE1|nr:uncharacterized protein HMPREF1541_10910 [Cyphellophora europaea CBS 101466]ETN44045.1 hypothetical protein HMPREF1541_10910 [Cyphellophora europaea CBS 101466]
MSTRVINDYTPKVSAGEPYRSPGLFCANVVDSGSPPIDGTYFWPLGNGSELWVNAPGATCPTRWAVRLTYGINTVAPDQYVYTDSGASVDRSAIGTPNSLYSFRPGFDDSLQKLMMVADSQVIDTTHCVPVMRSNPVSCRRGGNLEFGTNTLVAISDEGACFANNTMVVDIQTEPAMSKGLCTGSEVGQSTAVIGASGSYAAWLALAIGDEDNFNAIHESSQPGKPSAEYVVTCDYDVRNAYAFYEVTLSTQATLNGTTLRLVAAQGDNRCERPPSYGADLSGLLAEVAASSWQLLNENAGNDGWFDTLAQFAWHNVERKKRTMFAFNNSRNGLEDVLGLTAALVGAYMNSSLVPVPAKAIVANMRIGSGRAWAIAFVAPPLFTAIAIAVLLWKLSNGAESRLVEDLIVAPSGTEGQSRYVLVDREPRM